MKYSVIGFTADTRRGYRGGDDEAYVCTDILLETDDIDKANVCLEEAETSGNYDQEYIVLN